MMFRRQNSRKDSSESDMRDSDTNSESGDEEIHVPNIFIDATDYCEVIAEADNSLTASYRYQAPTESFVDLIGRDLDATERDKTEGFAKLIVNSWSQGEDGLNGETTMDRESYEEDMHDAAAVSSPKQPVTETASEIDRTGHNKLTSEGVVELLIEEFGPLTTSDGEKERLLSEYDGAFCEDVAIVGTIHLTTHRLAFHASLSSVKSDLSPKGHIIRKGPITVNIPKATLHRKRRVWLELTYDMVTSYPSSKDEDRIRPLKSILLSTIDNILPEDPAHPNLLKFQFSNSLGLRKTTIEVDTEESAREWRRDLKHAILLYRRNLEKVFHQNSEEFDSVRINIPFTAIRKLSSRPVLKMSALLSFDLRDDKDSSPFGHNNGEEKFLSNFTKGSVRRLDLVIINHDSVLASIKTIVEEAKTRAPVSPMTNFPKAVVDFGSLSIMEESVNHVESKDEKEHAIRLALALQSEPYVWYTRSSISRNIVSRGYFVVSSHYVCFWSRSWRTSFGFQYRLPVSIVMSVDHSRRLIPRVYGLVITLDGQPDLHFDFTSEDARNESIERIRALLDIKSNRPNLSSHNTSPLSSGTFSQTLVESPLPSPRASIDSTIMTPAALLSSPSRTLDLTNNHYIPCESRSKVINLPSDAIQHHPSKHFVCLTIGSRGDVQPYIALGVRLKKENHTVTIVTHEEYKEWIEGWGLKHRTAGGDPGALLKLSVDHKMFSPQFFKESLTHFRSWLDDLLVDAWEQCKDAEVLLESPSAMAGVHIAEALEIPYFRTFTMPWTKTSEFPHAFLSPPVDSPSFNSSSYILFDNILWTATSGQINRWRKNVLGLSSTDMGHMAQSKIPFIYNFSTAVVPKPLDWADFVVVSGYWFLDNPDINWSPSESLLKWIAQAKSDQKPIVYIGFGSITVPDPLAISRSITKAVIKSGVRAIVSKGWSARMNRDVLPEPEFPPECFVVDKIPHDWLFPQIDAAFHHGGAGTTGASLRAGIPTLIKPWFGDQFFWASRVQKMGVGLKVSSLRSNEISKALLRATSDRIMKEKAAAAGRKIRSEDGVLNAIQAIYTYCSRAKRSRSD